MPIGLHAAAVTTAPPSKEYVDNPGRVAYNRDLSVPFGVPVDDALWRSGRHVSHADLVDLLVADLPPGLSRPDLVILASSLPDLTHRKVVASYLNELTGGSALSFAVLGQGLGAPFMALRIVLAYAASGRCAAPLVAVLEQTTLPYHDPVVYDRVPLTDSGVLLSFGQDSGAWQIRSVSTLGSAEDLAARLPGLVSGARQPLAVSGPWIDPGPTLPFACQPVPPGSYGTSVWLALARNWGQWADEDYDMLVLCDTDPRSGVTHAAVLDRRAG